MNIKNIVTIDKSTNKILIYLKFTMHSPEFKIVIGKIKTLLYRQWKPDKKRWECLLCEKNYENLQNWGFVMDDKLKSWYQNLATDNAITIPQDTRLHPFQKKGVEFIEKNKGRILLADDMGLGKTIQSLYWANMHPELWPVLVICPAPLKINWQREIIKWAPKAESQILQGKKDEIMPDNDIIIINYNILSPYVKALSKKKFGIIIIDECQHVKNPKAQMTKHTKEIAKNSLHIIALSGTPIENRPAEFYSILSLLKPFLFPSWWYYINRYCGANYNEIWKKNKRTGKPKKQRILVYKEASNIEELHKNLSQIMLRRLKKDVLPELPDKIRTIIPVELDNKKEYNIATTELKTWLQSPGTKTKILKTNKIENLKQIAVQGKLKEITKWIADTLNTDNKLIVFCTHHFVIDFLKGKFGDIAVKLDGRDTPDKKQMAVDSFQSNSNIKLFIGNIKAAGTGITLTAASIVLFVELDWTPSKHDQAEDRAHRIGQKNAVNIYYIIGIDTIEEKIIALLDQKRRVLSQLLNGKEAKQNDLLGTLLNQMKGEE